MLLFWCTFLKRIVFKVLPSQAIYSTIRPFLKLTRLISPLEDNFHLPGFSLNKLTDLTSIKVSVASYVRLSKATKTAC
jgi:hypothetical protein